MYVTFNIQVSLLLGQPRALRSAEPRVALLCSTQIFYAYFLATSEACFATFVYTYVHVSLLTIQHMHTYEGWNFNSGNYLFATDTK